MTEVLEDERVEELEDETVALGAIEPVAVIVVQ